MVLSSIGRYQYGTGQKVYMIKLAQDYATLDDFLGVHVVDGKTVLVESVQRSMHDAPWKAGEQIGLVVVEEE